MAISCSRSLSSSTSSTAPRSLVIGLMMSLSSASFSSTQLFLALQYSTLDGAQRVDLLLERLLTLVAFLIRECALTCAALELDTQPLELVRDAPALHDLRRQQRGKAPDARRAGVGDRLEQLDGARVVAQRRRQGGEERREVQAVGRRAA